MESANRREVISQRFTVAPFESFTEFFDCFADDLFGLLYFHDCSHVSGAFCPLHQQRGGKVPKQRTGAKRLVGSGRDGWPAGVTQGFRGAKSASGDRRPGAYSPSRGNLKAARRGELAHSSPGRKP